MWGTFTDEQYKQKTNDKANLVGIFEKIHNKNNDLGGELGVCMGKNTFLTKFPF